METMKNLWLIIASCLLSGAVGAAVVQAQFVAPPPPPQMMSPDNMIEIRQDFKEIKRGIIALKDRLIMLENEIHRSAMKDVEIQ